MKWSVGRAVAITGIAAAMLAMTAATPALARHFRHGAAPADGPRIGYGYGGYGRSGYAYGSPGGYGYGYVGEAGVPYYYGVPYPYGYYQYPVGYQPDPYYGYGTGNYGTGLGY